MTPAERYNLVRWSPAGTDGLVESWSLSLHLPESGLAYDLRFVLRRPLPGLGKPAGSLLASCAHVSGDQAHGCDTFPLADLAASRSRFWLRIGPGELSLGRACGRVESGGGFDWDLTFETGSATLVLYPAESMVTGPFPACKYLTPLVSTRFYGTIRAGRQSFRVDGAPGVQGHAWGPFLPGFRTRVHALRFDDEDDAVFDAVTTPLRVGAISLPDVTLAGLRLRGREVVFNGPRALLANRVRAGDRSWEYEGASNGVRVAARFSAEPAVIGRVQETSSDGLPVTYRRCLLADGSVEVEGLPGGRIHLAGRKNAILEFAGTAP